jgi:hypothetical protein
VAHLNLYLPDDLAASLKQQANANGVPLSRLMLSYLPGGHSGDDWPTGFFEQVCGFLTEDMEEPADPPPDPVEALESL